MCISGRDIYFFSWLCVFLHVTFISSRDFVYFYTWHLFLLVTFCISARVIYFWTWRCVFLDVTFIYSRDFLYFCTCHLFLDVTLCISARASGSEISSRWYVISCFYDAIWSWYFWTRLPYFWTRLPYFWARRAPRQHESFPSRITHCIQVTANHLSLHHWGQFGWWYPMGQSTILRKQASKISKKKKALVKRSVPNSHEDMSHIVPGCCLRPFSKAHCTASAQPAFCGSSRAPHAWDKHDIPTGCHETHNVWVH